MAEPANVEHMSVPTYTLNDGTTLPAIGFGTYPMRGEDGVTAIVSALEGGYRLLDTAVNYENETEVGEALRRSGLPRDEVLVASKIPGRHHAYDDAIASVRGSLERLGVERTDRVIELGRALSREVVAGGAFPPDTFAVRR